MTSVSDLCGKPIRRENGEAIGHVFEVHADGSRVTALTCGSRAFFQRMKASRSGHRILWKDVVRVTAKEIVVANASS
jgi:sporulation protein YlmC with PRC-barrel domain